MPSGVVLMICGQLWVLFSKVPCPVICSGPKTVSVYIRSELMAKPNFKFQKRQKELDKKKKSDEKLQRKLDKNSSEPAENSDESTTEEETQ